MAVSGAAPLHGCHRGGELRDGAHGCSQWTRRSIENHEIEVARSPPLPWILGRRERGRGERGGSCRRMRDRDAGRGLQAARGSDARCG